MASFRYIVPALAVIGSAAAQTTAASSCSASATTTIQNQGDASAIAACGTFTGNIALATGTTGNIDLSGLSDITGSLIANNVSNLGSLSSSTLQTIGDTFYLYNDPALTNLGFPYLTKVDKIDWSGLPQLQGLSFTAQVQMASNLSVQNTLLGSLQGINLQMSDTVFIVNNPYLQQISMPLGNVTNALTLSANGDSLQASFPNLKWANFMSINATSLSTPSLQTVNTSLFVSNNRLTSYQAPNLTTIGQDLTFLNCAALSNLSFPVLTTVNGALTVNRTAVSNISFPSLTTVGGAVDFEGNFSSASLPKINSIAGACNLASTSDISSTCNTFQGYTGGSSPVIRGQYQCSSSTGNLTSGPAASGTSGASPSSTSHTNAAVPMQLPAMTGVLAVLAAMFGLL